MSDFRTIVSPAPSVHKMVISDKILTIGSCFSDAIGQKLTRNKMSALVNPFGILYNPHSILKALRYALSLKTPAPNTFLQQQDVSLNYDFHSSLSSLQANRLHDQLGEIIGAAHDFVRDAQWLIITFGTAWVYARKDNGEIVANCHKVPQSQFNKSLLTEAQLVDSFKDFHRELTMQNPKIRIILTVSPVRHMKDTPEHNSVSKAILRTVCFSLEQSYPQVAYFPAYEIMMDDLRDYRYYKPDMIHPSNVAEDYIWEKFTQQYFAPPLQEFTRAWDEMQRALAHRPFHPTSEAHQRFLKETLKKLEALAKFVPVDQEVAFITSKLLGQ